MPNCKHNARRLRVTRVGGDRAALGSVVTRRLLRSVRSRPSCWVRSSVRVVADFPRLSHARPVPRLGISEWSLSVWKCNACACGRRKRLRGSWPPWWFLVYARKAEWICAGKRSFGPLVVESNKWGPVGKWPRVFREAKTFELAHVEQRKIRRRAPTSLDAEFTWLVGRRCRGERVRVALRETTSWCDFARGFRECVASGARSSDFGRRARDEIAAVRAGLACRRRGRRVASLRSSPMETRWMRRPSRESRRTGSAEARIDAFQYDRGVVQEFAIAVGELAKRGFDKLLRLPLAIYHGAIGHGMRRRVTRGNFTAVKWDDSERVKVSRNFYSLFRVSGDLYGVYVSAFVNGRLCSALSGNCGNPHGPWLLPRRKDTRATWRYDASSLSSSH